MLEHPIDAQQRALRGQVRLGGEFLNKTICFNKTHTFKNPRHRSCVKLNTKKTDNDPWTLTYFQVLWTVNPSNITPKDVAIELTALFDGRRLRGGGECARAARCAHTADRGSGREPTPTLQLAN